MDILQTSRSESSRHFHEIWLGHHSEGSGDRRKREANQELYKQDNNYR